MAGRSCSVGNVGLALFRGSWRIVYDSNNDVQESSRGSVALNPPINGARSTMNTYLVDGAYNTDRNVFSAVIHPPMELSPGISRAVLAFGRRHFRR